MTKEGSGEKSRGDVATAEAESELWKLARDFWLKYHLARLGKNSDDVATEISQNAYERYLEKLGVSAVLPRDKVTEIVRKAQEEAQQDAETLAAEEKSILN